MKELRELNKSYKIFNQGLTQIMFKLKHANN